MNTGTQAAKEAGTELPPFKLAVGARLVFADGTPDVIAYPAHRHGWGRLTRLLTTGNRRAEKGACILHLSDLIAHADGLLLIALPPGHGQQGRLAELARAYPDRLWQGAMLHHGGSDRRRLAALSAVADAAGVPLLLIHGSGPGVSAFANWRLDKFTVDGRWRALGEGESFTAGDWASAAPAACGYFVTSSR
mgnify:CR=1 FL=1